MRTLKIGPNAFVLLLSLALSFIHLARGHAQGPRTFMIAAAAGYGVEDCLGEGSECGKVVADAWCQAHGGGAALKFGRSGGDADAISKASSSVPKPYFIMCGD